MTDESAQEPAAEASQAAPTAPEEREATSSQGTGRAAKGKAQASQGATAAKPDLVLCAYRGPSDTCVLGDGTHAHRHHVVEVERRVLMAAWNAGHHLDIIEL